MANNFNYDNYSDIDFPGDELNLSQKIVNFIKSITGLEYLVIIFVIISFIVVIIFGFLGQQDKNKDLQKQTDFELNLIPAINAFYKNSGGGNASSKAYPIAKCSGDLNEVDYEFTLRQSLTGKIIELDTFAYLQNSTFPTDRGGLYNTTFKDRKVNYRCPEKLNFSTTQNNLAIYEDGFKSCNFSSKLNYNNCYLYTSSSNGDSYQLAYYSLSTKCFIYYSQFRNETISKSSVCN